MCQVLHVFDFTIVAGVFYFMVEFVPLYCQFVLLSVLLKRITMTFSQ